jgi:imidazolonepropionase-like amidohydrolase
MLAGDDGAHAMRTLPHITAKMRQLLAVGAPLALGSDTGSPLHFQSGAVWWELEAWRAMGASHRQALAAATTGAARVLRLADVGRLDVGSRADFVLYRGNVESGPFDVTRVIAVGKGGILFVAEGRWTQG